MRNWAFLLITDQHKQAWSQMRILSLKSSNECLNDQQRGHRSARHHLVRLKQRPPPARRAHFRVCAWGPSRSWRMTVPLWARVEGQRRRGQEEASRVAVMTFQGKLRCGELYGSASAKWRPLFAQVVSASSPSHTRHNSFSSQSASEHRLSDCHCPWFITPVPATGA